MPDVKMYTQHLDHLDCVQLVGISRAAQGVNCDIVVGTR
jgi:hypothetical protein